MLKQRRRVFSQAKIFLLCGLTVGARSTASADVSSHLPSHELDTTRAPRADAGGRFLVPEVPSGTVINVVAGAGGCNLSDWPTGRLSIGPLQSDPLLQPGGLPSFTLELVISHPDNVMDDEQLYVFIQVTDGSPSSDDNVVLMLDNSHDHNVTAAPTYEASDDRGVRFYRDGRFERVYGSVLNPTLGPSPVLSGCIHGGAAGGGVGGGSWTVEAKLVPSDFGLNGFNALVGAAVVTRSLSSPGQGVWPSTALANPNTWANLITRTPIDYVLLIDQSGSMSGGKWDAARQAGDNFALILSHMGISGLDAEFSALPAVGNVGDRLGLATFTWNGGGIDQSMQQRPLALLSSTPLNYTSVLPVSPAGWTPIAAGVNKTVDMFLGGAPLTTLSAIPRTRVVMLLSDGKHNRPNPIINFTASALGDFTYVPTTCGSNSLVRVNTVAVGEDATVDPMTLVAIKNCFSGSVFVTPDGSTVNTYNTVPSNEPQLTAQLTKFFAQTLLPYYRLNMINDDGSNFSLKAGERKLLLLAFWANKADAVALSVNTPTGLATGTANTSLGYSFLVLNNPPGGAYTSFATPGATTSPMKKLVLVDARVEGNFAIDNRPHGTGSTITIRARLREDGRPVLGVDVRVDIGRPGEGFGTYVSTHTAVDCTPHAPRLPPRDSAWGKDLSRAGAAPVLPTDTGVIDVPARRFTLIQEIFRACDKDELSRTGDSGLRLVDDGTKGDALPNDGLYTLRFENTQFEGSYVFRFRATGTTADSLPLSLVKEVAEYVHVDVDPAGTSFGSRDVQRTGNLVIREFFVIPRDRFGGYLGPGYSNQVQFQTTAGTLVGAVRDYDNGIYSQLLRYDESQDRPVVTATIQGKPLAPLRVFRPFELVLPFAGRFFFANSLGLDDGTVVGARLGYRFTNAFTFEIEGGVTFADDTAGNSGTVTQALANLRYELYPLRIGDLIPHVTAGAGYAWFRGFGVDDEAVVYQAGAGATLRISDSFGVRADSRVFRIGDVFGAGTTTNVQVVGGLVWRF